MSAAAASHSKRCYTNPNVHKDDAVGVTQSSVPSSSSSTSSSSSSSSKLPVSFSAASPQHPHQHQAVDSKQQSTINSIQLLLQQMTKIINCIRTEYPIDPTSLSSSVDVPSKKDPFLYEGYGGVAYAFAQISQVMVGWKDKVDTHGSDIVREFAQSNLPSIEQLSIQYADVASRMTAALGARSRHRIPITFFMGTGGVFATQAIVALANGNSAGLNTALTSLLSVPILEKDTDLPNEILYGRAGYMHAMLLVHRQIQMKQPLHDKLKAIQDKIDECFTQILNNGLAYKNKSAKCPLMWEWHESRYLGAAHGVTGILYILMLVHWRFDPTDPNAPRIRSWILDTLDYCLSLRFESGNFPSSIKDEPSDRLVQWCHGATAFALAFMQAYSTFGRDPKYLKAAKDACEVVWQRGLLKKGLGLCHGIGGNGYVFLKLFEITHDVTHLERAMTFAKFALTSPESSALQQQPDFPSSLGNGRAGFGCFIVDLLNLYMQAYNEQVSKDGSKNSSNHAEISQKKVCFPGLDLLE